MPMAFHDGMVNNRVEYIFAFGNNDKRIFTNPQYKKGSLFNVVDGSNAHSNKHSSLHSATFPTYLPEYFIRNFTNKNAIVLDLFCGTGTTMFVSEQMKRICYAVEISPIYCEITILRMLNLDPTLKITINGKDVTKKYLSKLDKF